MNVTALLAHPDDELACAGTLAKFVDAGDTVNLIVAFADADRSNELHQSADILGVRLTEIHFSELHFGWTQATVKFFEPVVANTNPDQLLGHRVADDNSSHHPLAMVLRTVARKNRVSLWEIDAALPGGIETEATANNMLVDIDEQHHRKYDALNCYRSVMYKYPGIKSAFMSRDMHNGWLLHMDEKSHYAEALRIHKAVWL